MHYGNDPEMRKLEKLAAERTEQEIKPHPRLVEVRQIVENGCGRKRADAARVANHLTHQECDKILKLGSNDGKKIQELLVRASQAADEADRRPL
ncbi:MAG: hypothetical protein IH897_13270 [Planctomycetes bacterium]|nr:hypothetical protein [Planctomycetota bacterium]